MEGEGPAVGLPTAPLQAKRGEPPSQVSYLGMGVGEGWAVGRHLAYAGQSQS